MNPHSAHAQPSAVELYILWAQRELVARGGRQRTVRIDQPARSVSGSVTPFGRADR